MKAKNIFAALLLFAAGSQTAWAQKVTLHLAGRQPVRFSIEELDSLICEEEHEYVDLGLPSGTLWATCNVGANSPEEFGYFFAWGETQPKEDYSWDTYIYCKGSENTLTKYCTNSTYGYNGFTDALDELLPEDDAATANWGRGWQMPSMEQIKELFNEENTTQTLTKQNGVDGWLIRSKSNNGTLFLPAAYNRQSIPPNGGGTYVKQGGYWSRSLWHSKSNSAYEQGFTLISNSSVENFGAIVEANDTRDCGHSVRPVRKQ